MLESPYASPQSNLTESPPRDPQRDRIRRIANHQRLAILGLFLHIGFYFAAGALVIQGAALPLPITATAVAILIVICATATILLSREWVHTAVAVLFGVLQVVPLINLVLLITFIVAAGNYLHSQGIRVGWAGADPGQIH